MTVCGNKLSGVCGDCTYFNRCRNDEISKLPKTNIEWMREASAKELADIFMRFMFDADFKTRFVSGNFYDEFAEWLKEKHNESV